ncbi:transcriptional regulator [Amylibacter kogurei]|uniref:Transcriptional regulator n=1 Tax=Paramylibacter kogurei TaxID=1889778 RepID=A0A2G5KAC9_9RHOB|nr:metalloregulator ArsR/SmtB family transcription factor [Amylibacter kogurei]PIB25983.1 transcriptional regulator [Amylibacter kogurei]
MKHFDDTTLTLTQAASAFAALGSEQRLMILQTLVRAGPDGLSMGALGERTDVTGSTLTHHLKFLTAAGLVEQAKRGRSIVCAAVAYDMINELSEYLLRNCCADADCHHTDSEHRHG